MVAHSGNKSIYLLQITAKSVSALAKRFDLLFCDICKMRVFSCPAGIFLPDRKGDRAKEVS